MRLGAVLNQGNAPLPADLLHRPDVEWLSVEVDCDYCAGLGCDPLQQVVWIDVERPGIDIGKCRTQALEEGTVGCGYECEGGGYHLAPRLQPQSPQCQVQGSCAVADGNGVFCTQILCELLLEEPDCLALGEHAAPQHIGGCGDLIVADDRPGYGNKLSHYALL